MSFLDQGFLSDLSEVRSAVHSRYANYRIAFMRLNEQCMAAQYTLSISAEQPRDLLGAAFFMRTIASCQAAVILLEHGLPAQAKTVLRSSLESLFSLAAIEAKPELALSIAQSQDANKRSLADKMLRWECEELQASRDSSIGEEELLELKLNNASEFKTWALAKEAGMTDWYLSCYALLSQSAHATVSDMTSHLVIDKDGNISAFKSEPEVDGQELVWAFTMQIQLRAAHAVTNMFGINTIDVSVHENALRALERGSYKPCGAG